MGYHRIRNHRIIRNFMLSNLNETNLTEVYLDLINEQTKQTRFAKWARNLTTDIFKLKTYNATKKNDMPIPKEIEESLGLSLNKYKNYKTLWNTSIIAGIPLLGPLFAVPYSINAFLTDIQKKAGKIGVMKAMEEIDDPRVFAESN